MAALRLSGRGLFGLWFGLFLPPITIGALVLTFCYHWSVGLGTLVLFLGWIIETGRTTCSRCWAYGTAGCGLPSLVAPLFSRRKPPGSLTRSRILLHFFIDVVVGVYLNLLYLWLYPSGFVFVLLWSLGAWHVALGPKKYHGLLDRLRSGGVTRPLAISLPVLSPEQTYRDQPYRNREQDERPGHSA